LFRNYPWLVAGIVLFSFLTTITEGLGIGLILPLLDTSLLLNNTSNGSSFKNIVPFVQDLSNWLNELTLVNRVRLAALGLATVMLIRTIFTVISELLGTKLHLNIERDLEKRVFEQMNDLQLSYIHRQKMGELITFFSYSVRRSGALIQQVIAGIGHLFTFIVYLIIVLFISWQLSLAIGSFLCIIGFLGNRLFSKVVKQAGKKQVGFRQMLRTQTLEVLYGLKQIHLFARKSWAIDRFYELVEAYTKQAYRSAKLIRSSKSFVVLTVVFSVSSFLLACTYFIPNDLADWLPKIVLLLVIAFRLLTPVAGLNSVHTQVVNLSSKLESVFDFLNRSDKPYLQNGTIPMGQLQTGIRFKNVSFRYDNAEQDVLQDLTFEIPKNKMTAIVGTSGAGKSSIVNLIARLYDCSSGEILIDNKNIKAYQIESWRQSMAVVSQDTFIFNESVLTNIRFAKLDATLEEVIEAAKLAQAHEFIEALPQQYDTLLGDRGVRLSGGQQRRITIARAIVVLPQLLIFDEATSDLDSETEQALQEAIGQFRGNRTMLVIAHRLSTIRDADNILVLEAGRIVEQGNHQVLIQNNRLYKRLVEKQNLISID